MGTLAEAIRDASAHPRSRGEHTWCSEPHSAKAAQPRLRWEHTELSLHDFFKRGSSPLTRGTLARPSGRSAVHGLIPARAGNTRCRSRCHGYWWAHPRSRGEHRTLTLPRLPAEGSSPLARGTSGHCGSPGGCPGLIPARAGNITRFHPTENRRWAHPRSRGEHNKGVGSWWAVAGSSPLARGTPCATSAMVPSAGLIPARAGNTR